MELRGAVTQVHRLTESQRDGSIVGAIEVAGSQEDGTSFPDASVTITEDTLFFQQVDQAQQPATFDDVAAGQRVQVQFAGPVQETYPIRGTASDVVILAD